MSAPQFQADWVGGVSEPAFKDIANTRSVVAERKAELCLLIKKRCGIVPASVADGSIGVVRDWKASRESALKACGNWRSSVGNLEAALNSMARFK